MNNQTIRKVSNAKELQVGDYVLPNNSFEGATPVGMGQVVKKTPECLVAYFPFWDKGHDGEGLVDKPISDTAYWIYPNKEVARLNLVNNVAKPRKTTYLVRVTTQEVEGEKVKATFKLSLKLRNKMQQMITPEETTTEMNWHSGTTTEYTKRYLIKSPYGRLVTGKSQMLFIPALLKGDTAEVVFSSFDTLNGYIRDIKLAAAKIYEEETIKKKYTIQLVMA